LLLMFVSPPCSSDHFFFYCPRTHLHLHSFPTRRSSDLSFFFSTASLTTTPATAPRANEPAMPPTSPPPRPAKTSGSSIPLNGVVGKADSPVLSVAIFRLDWKFSCPGR